MHVVGGIYEERCAAPAWEQIFGSAGRAACFISAISKMRVHLHGWYSRKELMSLQASLAPYHVDLDVKLAGRHARFSYFHPLSAPSVRLDSGVRWSRTDEIRGRAILAFGAFEGMPSLNARRIVIDPQGDDLLTVLRDVTIRSQEIAIVANEQEVKLNTKKDLRSNVSHIFDLRTDIMVVVVKQGPYGATVFRRDARAGKRVSSYWANRVFKIGSGDIFSAAFALLWAGQRKHEFAAADFASRAVSCYVNDPYLNFDRTALQNATPVKPRRNTVSVYLAGPFFTLADNLLLIEARRCLQELGAQVFSPLHEVGRGAPKRIARQDLKGLSASNCLLALMHNNDPGTIFEVGYARSQGIPVVLFCEQAKDKDLTMFLGTNCIIETDFCSALYKSIWVGVER
jgi:nucleoside 2-deoxyribosyltransferase